MDAVDFYLQDLQSKFQKISSSQYYLSYLQLLEGSQSAFLKYYFKESYEILNINVD